MNDTRDHLESLHQIRSMMERSTTFMSLTGLSGVMAGLYGLVAFGLIAYRLDSIVLDDRTIYRMLTERGLQEFLVGIAVAALSATLLTAFILTYRKARRRGQAIWDNVSQRFAGHLFVPLGAGGLFTLALLYHGQVSLVCPAMLLFFGLALISSARFVQVGMVWLGLVEIGLGLVAAFWYPMGLILWAAGFGLATLTYGALMYLLYER